MGHWVSKKLYHPTPAVYKHHPQFCVTLIKNHLVVSHAQPLDLSSKIVGALRTRLQLLHQVALSCRQVGAHLFTEA